MFAQMMASSGGGSSVKYITHTENASTSWKTVTIDGITDIIAIKAENASTHARQTWAMMFNGTLYNESNAGSGYGVRNISGNTFEYRYSTTSSTDFLVIGT